MAGETITMDEATIREFSVTQTAQRMLEDRVGRSIREYLVDHNLIPPGSSRQEFEVAIQQLDPTVVESIRNDTEKHTRDLFLHIARDQHRIDTLEDASQKNKLTGLANREMAADTFGLLKELPEFDVQHHPMAVVGLDLDGFKLINDQAGHPTGDEVLKLVGKKIKGVLSKLRTTDLAIHFSGDEFGLILTNLKPGKNQDGTQKTLPQTIKEVVARVISSIEDIAEVQLADGTKIPVTLSASAGFKIVEYGDISDFSAINEHAEQAEKIAKNCRGIERLKQGKTRIVDADQTEDEFLAEHSISNKEYEDSKKRNGLTRPTNDILALAAQKADKIVTLKKLAKAESLKRRYIEDLEAVAAEED